MVGRASALRHPNTYWETTPSPAKALRIGLRAMDCFRGPLASRAPAGIFVSKKKITEKPVVSQFEKNFTFPSVYAQWDNGPMESKRPRDPNQLAKLIVDIATGEVADDVSDKKKAVSVRGRNGGLKGGKARAVQLNADERTDIARIGAEARWKKR
jgi:hypothetical protein